MVAAISHSIIQWTQETILEPTVEGLARIDRSFHGVNFHHIDYPKLDWSRRVVDFLTGIVLLFPLLNSVFWVFTKTFANPELLAEPFVSSPVTPWIDASVASANPIIIDTPVLMEPRSDDTPRVFSYKTSDQKYDNRPTEATIEVRSYRNCHVVKRSSLIENSEANYTIDWALQSLTYENKDPSIRAFITSKKLNNTIVVTGTNKGAPVNKTFVLDNPEIPWIQQGFGFRPFVTTSNASQIRFYGIDPRDITLAILLAKKTEETVLGEYQRRATKVETFLTSGWLSWVPMSISEDWYDKETGLCYQTNFGLRPFVWGHSKLIK